MSCLLGQLSAETGPGMSLVPYVSGGCLPDLPVSTIAAARRQVQQLPAALSAGQLPGCDQESSAGLAAGMKGWRMQHCQ